MWSNSRRVPQFGDLNFSAALFLVTNVTISSRKLFSYFSAFWAPWDHPTGSTTIFSRAERDGNVRLSSSCTWSPMTPEIVQKNFGKCFLERNKKINFFSPALFVSTLVMMHDDPPPNANVSRRGSFTRMSPGERAGHTRGSCCACQASYISFWSFYVDQSTTLLLSILDPPSLCF